MGSLLFKCPPEAEIADIPKVTCPEKFGQIQRIALRRKQDPAEETPTFPTVASLLVQANWTTAMAAADITKIQVTPFISGLVLPPGTPILEEGNNNNTVNGISLLQGWNNVMVNTARFLNLPSAIAKVLRTYTQYSALTPGFTDLEAFFFTEHGHIIHDMELDGIKPKGFDIFNWVVPSVGSEGLNKANVHNLQFELLGTYDDLLEIADPTSAATPWNPLNL